MLHVLVRHAPHTLPVCLSRSLARSLQDLQDVSYLLSPQDLMALEQLPQLVAAGVSCFKIEGRLKGPEYVAATTAAYRAGVDAAWEQLQQQQQQQDVAGSIRSSGSSGSNDSTGSSSLVAPEVLSALSQVFSRSQDEGFGGLTPGFLEGSRHQRLVRGRSPRHRGLCLGRIAGEYLLLFVCSVFDTVCCVAWSFQLP